MTKSTKAPLLRPSRRDDAIPVDADGFPDFVCLSAADDAGPADDADGNADFADAAAGAEQSICM